MQEYNGDCPKNARIKIDYSKEKPVVSFSYPHKRSQVSGSMFFPIFMFWILLLMLFSIGSSFTEMRSEFKKVPKELSKCQIYYENKFIQNSDYYTEYLCKNKNATLSNIILPNLEKASNLFNILDAFSLLAIVFLPPIIIYFPFRRRWNKLYPKWQSLTSRKKVAIFKSKDIKEEDSKYYCELPVFSNVVCNYEATKDFSRYLKLFEIREHKFRYYRIKRKRKQRYFFGLFKIKNKHKYKRKGINEWLWYARFYFSDKPKTGKLEVIFK